jgi:homoserine kinase
MNHDSIKIRTPATVANVSCGLDSLGYAISNPADVITIKKTDHSGLRITLAGVKSQSIPTHPEKNTAGKSVLSLLKFVDKKQGFHIHIEKGIPPGSGLGSSAASAVGAAFGVNHLLGSPLKSEDLLIHCVHGESVSSGTGHADNVAPALLGGIVLVRSCFPLDVIKLPVPENLISINVMPDFAIFTHESRRVLPKQVLLKSAIQQAGNLSGFTASLYSNDFELMNRSLVDLFAEPKRSLLIPGYDKVHKSAMDSGAIGCGISGSGPSIFSLSDSMEKAKAIGNAMVKSFKDAKLNSELFISPVHLSPPKILD